MSGGDNPFARWSRRKLGARDDGAEAAPGNAAIREEAAADVEADFPTLRSDAARTEAVEAETADPAEPLPRLEDLTAESDLTAFLKKGVPLALKSAALRKMWSLDPGIRDYVGPSEYAWDFNQPGSMAGFGPMDAKETVVGFLSKTVRAIDPEAEPAPATQPPAAPAGPSADTPPDMAANAKELPAAAEPDPPAGAATSADAASDAIGPTDQRHDSASESQIPEPVVRPRHGGALPR